MRPPKPAAAGAPSGFFSVGAAGSAAPLGGAGAASGSAIFGRTEARPVKAASAPLRPRGTKLRSPFLPRRELSYVSPCAVDGRVFSSVLHTLAPFLERRKNARNPPVNDEGSHQALTQAVVKRCPQRWHHAAAEKRARWEPAPNGGASGGWKMILCLTC